jgi:hypothetical protein
VSAQEPRGLPSRAQQLLDRAVEINQGADPPLPKAVAIATLAFRMLPDDHRASSAQASEARARRLAEIILRIERVEGR